jgi:hypothetical protein
MTFVVILQALFTLGRVSLQCRRFIVKGGLETFYSLLPLSVFSLMFTTRREPRVFKLTRIMNPGTVHYHNSHDRVETDSAHCKCSLASIIALLVLVWAVNNDVFSNTECESSHCINTSKN